MVYNAIILFIKSLFISLKLITYSFNSDIEVNVDIMMALAFEFIQIISVLSCFPGYNCPQTVALEQSFVQ
jgi:hypothetical protein